MSETATVEPTTQTDDIAGFIHTANAAERAGDGALATFDAEQAAANEPVAAAVEEALSRTRYLIAETGHAGTHYHVFIKAEPDVLLAQLPRLTAEIGRAHV